MESLVQEFEKPFTDRDGTGYRLFVLGRSRPADIWQGWLVFERLSDGRRFPTGVETTQPSGEAVLYWATGLAESYFEGALDRARLSRPFDPTGLPAPEPVTGRAVDSDTRAERLAAVERAVLACFGRHHRTRLETRTVFEELAHAHADVVRALEDLEKVGGLLVRRTEEGTDWLFLTRRGMAATGLTYAGEPASPARDLPGPR